MSGTEEGGEILTELDKAIVGNLHADALEEGFITVCREAMKFMATHDDIIHALKRTLKWMRQVQKNKRVSLN